MPKRRRSSAGHNAISPPLSDTTTDPDAQDIVRPRLEKGKGRAIPLPLSPTAKGTPSGKLDLGSLITHQEVFLRVLSFLNAGELARVQGVARYWQAMSLDQQLWKRLYLARYPHPHHTRLISTPSSTPRAGGSTPTSTSTTGAVSRSRSFRPISRLPSRAFPPPSPSPSRRFPPIPPSSLGDAEDDSDVGAARRGRTGSEGGAGRDEGMEPGSNQGAGDAEDANAREFSNAVKARPVRRGVAIPFVRPGIGNIGSASADAAQYATKADPSGEAGASQGSDTGAPGHTREVGSGVRHEGVDWKMMLRLGTNWTNGSASRSETITLPPSPSPSLTSLSDPIDRSAPLSAEHPSSFPNIGGSRAEARGTSEQHLALSPDFIFTSSPLSPLVQVYRAHPRTHPSSGPGEGHAHMGIIPPPPGWSSPHRPDNVTAIASDQSIIDPGDPAPFAGSPGADNMTRVSRLAIFYQSGGIVILRIASALSPVKDAGGMTAASPNASARLQWTREAILAPTSRPPSVRRRATTYSPVQGDPVVLAALHWPVLITCTRAFHLSVYSLSSGPATSIGNGKIECLKTLHSDVSFHPASLSLLPAPQNGDAATEGGWGRAAQGESQFAFKAALTYCTPVYPYSWTIAVQELDITPEPQPMLAAPPPIYSTARGQVHRASLYRVSRPGSGEDAYTWPRTIRPIPGVKGVPRGIGSDGRWCVLAGDEDQIEVFALPASASNGLSDGNRADEDQGDAIGESGLKRPRIRGFGDTEGEEEEGAIEHVHTLRMQVGISAVELSAGKCVVAGEDGRLVVWDLDRLADAEVEDAAIGGDGLTGAGGVSMGEVPSVYEGRTLGFVEVTQGKGKTPALSSASRVITLHQTADDAASERVTGKKNTAAATSIKRRGRSQRTEVSLEPGDAIESESDTDLDSDSDSDSDEAPRLPHPKAISSAARAFFLPLPPLHHGHRERADEGTREVVHHVAFDEEKIVGMVRLIQNGQGAGGQGGGGEGMKVWSFA